MALEDKRIKLDSIERKLISTSTLLHLEQSSVSSKVVLACSALAVSFRVKQKTLKVQKRFLAAAS